MAGISGRPDRRAAIRVDGDRGIGQHYGNLKVEKGISPADGVTDRAKLMPRGVQLETRWAALAERDLQARDGNLHRGRSGEAIEEQVTNFTGLAAYPDVHFNLRWRRRVVRENAFDVRARKFFHCAMFSHLAGGRL